ncbi:hypothetical protein [Pontibacter ruber]|uniref:DUF1735 domain-containing protein n=1 Tax=Pontibacter ruber TaxID=1343895 RepID=A0ABW5CZS3_9BACT|nr:hypothetical protein [Pontibacter ruber]
MKSILFSLLALVAFVSISCEKIDDLLTFYIDEEEMIKIDSAFPVGMLVPLTPVNVTTNSEETFKNNKTRAELVKDVSLNKLTLTITDPAGENFNFLRKVEIYLSNDKGEETRIAYLDEIPQNVNTITLKSTNAKLDNYIKGESYSVRTKATIGKPLSNDISIKAAMRFKVTADPI